MIKLTSWPLFSVLLLTMVLNACNNSEENPADRSSPDSNAASGTKRFELLSAEQSGISFRNEITESRYINYFDYGYIYNGGGVGIGDFDQDGLMDVYLTGTMTSDRLYRNKGNLQFEDITESAGLAGFNGFITGVSVSDINADGWPDIFVCRTGKNAVEERSNLVFLNDGDGTFTESAATLGLAKPGNTNHVAWLDMDGDGDLDLYELNHPVRFGTNTRPRMKNAVRYTLPDTPEESDRIYRNDGGRFTDVSTSAGIKNSAFGLSVSVADFNDDGYTDIFVANDYIEPDFLYINNGRGQFTDRYSEYFAHISQNSMGSDVADLNSDGLLDLLVLDMLPETHYRQRTLMTTMMLDRYSTLERLGYGRQQMRNVLQINNGSGGFSEIAQQAGVDATDWSWGPLMADFDNDGRKDIFIANGYRRDVTDNDFRKYKNDSLRGSLPESMLVEVLNRIPEQRLQNYMYQQQGDLDFQNVSRSWGLTQQTFSNGAAFADLDNDGDLDLVINNIEQEASILKNNTDALGSNNWMRLALSDQYNNPWAVGAKVEFSSSSGIQTVIANPCRGFFSSVDPVVHVGLGSDSSASVKVTWSDGTVQDLGLMSANKLYEVERGDASVLAEATSDEPMIKAINGPEFRHQENAFEDFRREFLLPRRLSREGPALARADVNGDGAEDLYLGGAAGQNGTLFIQQNGQMRASTGPWSQHAAQEDVSAAFFDADGDGDMDLAVGSGGNWLRGQRAAYRSRLYLNDGDGTFSEGSKRLKGLPETTDPAGVILPLDFDGDGDMDLFLGSRTRSGSYPLSPVSYLLRNEGGQFELAWSGEIGMITDAAWGAVEAGEAQLILVGEWQPVRLANVSSGQLEISKSLPNSSGWWNSVDLIDTDGDGDLDLVTGNLGLNSRFEASSQYPIRMLAKDFDGNGQVDPVIFYYPDGIARPLAQLDILGKQLPMLNRRFGRYAQYAAASLDEVFLTSEQEGALELTCEMLENSIWVNQNGEFLPQALPTPAQSFPLQDAVAADVNADGLQDLICVGNFYHLDIESGPIAAGHGLLLQSTGQGQFKTVPANESGLYAPGDTRAATIWQRNDGLKVLTIAANDGDTRSFVLPTPQP